MKAGGLRSLAHTAVLESKRMPLGGEKGEATSAWPHPPPPPPPRLVTLGRQSPVTFPIERHHGLLQGGPHSVVVTGIEGPPARMQWREWVLTWAGLLAARGSRLAAVPGLEAAGWLLGVTVRVSTAVSTPHWAAALCG